MMETESFNYWPGLGYQYYVRAHSLNRIETQISSAPSELTYDICRAKITRRMIRVET